MPPFKARASGCAPIKTPVITPENIPPRFSHRLQSGKKHLNHEKRSTSSGAFGTAGSGKPDQIRDQYPDSPGKGTPVEAISGEIFRPHHQNSAGGPAPVRRRGFLPVFTGTEPASVFLEPAGILAAILLATCVGFAFEVSANKKFEILNQVNDDTMVQVIRGGNICELPRRDVVVGDIVILNTGEEVPADGVLLEAVSLQVNESTLTGEPLIGKTTDEEEFKKDATYPSNHVLKGTTVADGHGVMEVTSVGDRTEYGKVYEGSQIDNKVQTPLNRQLSRLGDLITWASYAIAAFIVIGRLTLYFPICRAPWNG